jgi:prepilin-type N-terminal cleavage/methylation domain-containing protein
MASAEAKVMTATSGFCPPRNSAVRAHAAGFTLIELLVVFALIALVTGLVVPAGIRAIENAQRRGAMADINALLAVYPLRAFHNGKAMSVDAVAIRGELPDAPQELQIQMDAPLAYAANGMASGGQVRAGFGDGAWETFNVDPVTGVVHRAGTAP